MRQERRSIGIFRGTASGLAVLAVAAALIGTQAGAITPADLAFRQAVSEEVTGKDAVAAFYKARDYAPIWTSAADAARRGAVLDAMERAGEHGLPDGVHDVAALRAAFANVASERQRGRLEAEMTEAAMTQKLVSNTSPTTSAKAVVSPSTTMRMS